MKYIIHLSLLAPAIFLAGCGDDATSNTNEPQYEAYIEEALERDTTIDFTLRGNNANVPLPSFALMNTSDGTLEIPTDGDDELTNPRAAMGTMDGWSTSMPLIMGFEGAGLADGNVMSGVYLVELTGSFTDSTTPTVENVLTLGVDYLPVASAASDTLNIVLLKDLNPSSEYILAITDEVLDVNGDPVGTSSSYAALKSGSKSYSADPLKTVQQITQGVEAIFDGAGLADNEDIIYSTWFSTQSVGDTLFAVKGATATGLSAGGIGSVWKDSANPNDVNLAAAYTMSFGTTQSFTDAIDADADFDRYISDEEAVKDAFKLLYAGVSADVNVTQGTIYLPHYLEKGADWDSQPMESAMPSLALISEALGDEDEAAVVGAQLVTAGIDPSSLATSTTEQLKLVGLELTTADGSRLDPERIITRYAPVPQIKSLEAVEFLLFTPNGSTASDIVIYQHGITSAKENAYAFAFNMAQAGVAVIAIDLPLHGTRSLDEQRSANASALAYLNLNNLAVARDNVRQSILDVLGVRAGLAVSAQAGLLTGSPLSGFNPATGSTVKFVGHSLGGIVGTSAVAAANRSLGDPSADILYTISAGSIQNSGGQIANLLLGSASFGPVIKHNLALAASTDYSAFAAANCTALEDADCYLTFESVAGDADKAALASGFNQFAYAAQTVLDTIDPYTNATYLVDDATGVVNMPFYMQQVDGDATVPNAVEGAPLAGTEPLATKLGLTVVDSSTNVNPATDTSSFVKFNSTASHSTFVAPQDTSEVPAADLPHHAEMQALNTTFVATEELPAVSNTSTLE